MPEAFISTGRNPPTIRTGHPLHFTIVAPQYSLASNGVMVVYLLGELLEKLGHSVTYTPLEPDVFQRRIGEYSAVLLSKFETDPSRLPADSIAILPEIALADVLPRLPAKHRVWYLLNKPYVLTGRPICYEPQDLVVSYSGLINKTHYNLFITREIAELASGPNRLDIPPVKENLLLLYFGKSRTTEYSDEIKQLIKTHHPKVVIISRIFPSSRAILFDLLRRARLLISYDPLTNLNYEATLCGTPCCIADNYMRLNFEDFNLPLHGFFQGMQHIDRYYREGLAPETLRSIHEHYRGAQHASIESVRGFVELCRNWFLFVAEADHDPVKAAFLVQQNELRLQMDRIAFELSGSVHIVKEMKSFSLAAFLSVPERIVRRKDRLVWNARRNWYKHVRGLRGPELDRKLNEMRMSFEKRTLGIKW